MRYIGVSASNAIPVMICLSSSANCKTTDSSFAKAKKSTSTAGFSTNDIALSPVSKSVGSIDISYNFFIIKSIVKLKYHFLHFYSKSKIADLL